MAKKSMDPMDLLHNKLEEEGVDLPREMLREFAERLMSAEVDGICGAAYGERSWERVNRRNGYRSRRWDARAGSIDLAIPRLRQGSYFPAWLPEPRRGRSAPWCRSSRRATCRASRRAAWRAWWRRSASPLILTDADLSRLEFCA